MSVNRDESVVLVAGDVVGQFTVTKVLRHGRGGMGQVALATLPDGRPVALKVALNTGYNDMIENEALLLRRLRHPNIVSILALDSEQKQFTRLATKLRQRPRYFIMEYLRGGDLETYLSQKGRLAVVEAAEIAWQMASALAACRAAGACHRDVKPDNIMFRYAYPGNHRAPQAVLIDFGIGKRLDQKAIPAGALPYMAPEWIRAIKANDREAMGLVDHRADVYSLGAVFYQMLCGRPPFSAKDMATTTQILEQRPEPPATFNPNLSKYPQLSRLIMTMLSKSSAERPDADDVVRWLDAVVPPQAREGWFRGRKRANGNGGATAPWKRWALVGGAAAGMLGVVALAANVNPPPPPVPPGQAETQAPTTVAAGGAATAAPTKRATSTPAPTSTPEPTSTPVPTATPTPVLSATPTPTVSAEPPSDNPPAPKSPIPRK